MTVARSTSKPHARKASTTTDPKQTVGGRQRPAFVDQLGKFHASLLAHLL
jgi:hypothetical protein